MGSRRAGEHREREGGVSLTSHVDNTGFSALYKIHQPGCMTQLNIMPSQLKEREQAMLHAGERGNVNSGSLKHSNTAVLYINSLHVARQCGRNTTVYNFEGILLL